MRSRIIRKLRARIRAWGSGVGNSEAANDSVTALSSQTIEPQLNFSAVDKFYQDYLENHLAAFDSFALQSRSISVRSVYARAASGGCHDIVSLQMEIDELLQHAKYDESVLQLTNYKLPVLISLANYLLETSRSDLDTHSGLQILRYVLLKYGEGAFSENHKLQFLEALSSLGEYAEEEILSDRFDLDSIAPMQAELMAINRIAQQSGSPALWLQAMNAFYTAHGLQTIRLKEDASLPLLDRLTTDTGETINGPLVTVIIPTYSPDERIFTAVESLLDQTWKNLEILIVDDGSPEAFEVTLTEVAQLDPRIRVIRQRTNGGAYTARNAGLAESSGEYVTTHDDDDWSHPEKIATQAAALLTDETTMAAIVAHVRTTEDMRFQRINSRPRHLQINYSSLMFRKSVTDLIGGWDTSNRGSDSELFSRIRANYGRSAIVRYEDKPLSFSRVWDGSLTSGQVYRGYFAYSRLLYRWSFQDWHREAKKSGAAPILESGESRPFAIPTTFEPANRNRDLGQFDVLYVSDYDRRAKFASTVFNEIKSAAGAGLRVGYMHINSPQTLRRGMIMPGLFELQLAGHITQIAEDDIAETKLLVVYDSSIGMFLDNFMSTVVVQQGVVVEDNGASLQTSERRVVSRPLTVLRNLDKGFRSRFRMVGAGRYEQQRLRNELPPERLLPDHFLWKTHITTRPMETRQPAMLPAVGFHSFGNKYRWPSTRDAFESAYHSGDHRTLFYGNIKAITQLLGDDIIEEDQFVDPSSFSLAEYFEMIDFWVHYPHERLDNRPWGPVLEALQAGKVVILPQHMEDIYGDAAIYSRPEKIGSVVAEYSSDDAKYIEQAKRGQDFVDRHHNQAAYVSRLKDLVERTDVVRK